MTEKYYVTTPIYYTNGKPHIGHAYTAIACDVLARFQRAEGHSVFFLSGTDEHGLKMQQAAEKEGVTPQALADKNSTIFVELLEKFNCSQNDFIRTTQPRHQKACQALWQRMSASGDIYLGRYKGWYSVRQEAYYDESDTFIGEDGIRREKEVGSPVEWNEEESYFFRLSAYQDKLLAYYAQNPEFLGPKERKNEIISFVKSGLKDLSISRTTFHWGVPVPNDPNHVMYVWVDALTNYLTALGFPDLEGEKGGFWPASAHIIGKDIIRFHAIYWPAFLMSAGLALPQRVFAHGFLLSRGEKMSKSVGNIVDPFALIDEYGLDQVRYFLLREIPFGQDGSYSHEAIINRSNADLANDLGNLAQRSLSMIAKDRENRVPAPAALTSDEEALLAQSIALIDEVRNMMSSQAFHSALTAIFKMIADVNRYFAGQAPWTLKKNDPARFDTVLYITLEVLRRIAILLRPFIPDSADALLTLLGVEKDARLIKNIIDSPLQAGVLLPEPRGIFPRLNVQKDNAHAN
ncbi:methionine--tRNA ligase [Bartonella sp. DGB2]|uniref:methionine--tRNA ligase n=1 Tax=Bartonella sp. DGB2 TaxID=3388426 RepID=UPI00398F983A